MLQLRSILSEGRLAAVLIALLAGTSAQTPPPAPDVGLTFANPSYTFAASCNPAQPLAFVAVVAANRGAAATGPFNVVAIDAAGMLRGAYLVRSLAPGATADVTVPLMHVGAGAVSQLGGVHAIDVFVKGATIVKLSLPFPATLCAPPGPNDGLISARKGRVAFPTPSPNPLYQTATTATNKKVLSTPGETTMTATTSSLSTLLTVAAPGNLRSVTAGTDCGAHVGAIGALVCRDMMKSGDLLLIWDWQPGSGPDKIDGYRIYTGTAGLANQLVATKPNQELTLFDVPKPRDGSGYNGKCYAVSAYAGTRESGRSPLFCAGGASAAKTIRLSAIRWRHSIRQQNKRSYDNADSDPGRLDVGFAYGAQTHILGDSSQASIYRSATLFDLSGLRNHRLFSARLRLAILKSDGVARSCLTEIGSGVDSWWQHDRWLEGRSEPSAVPADAGARLEVDVTRFVAAWMRGEPNFGFVLRNADENLGAFTNKVCMTTYTEPTLEVTYY